MSCATVAVRPLTCWAAVAICEFREVTSVLRPCEVLLKAEASVLAAVSTAVCVAASVGSEERAVRDEKKLFIAEPSVVELASVEVEVRPNIDWIFCSAVSTAVLALELWVCCCNCCSKTRLRCETAVAETELSRPW